MSETQRLNIFFHALDGIGHLNACVGLAQALAKRGHRITFLLNDAFKGQYAKYGFEEILLYYKSPETELEEPEERNPVKKMAEQLIAEGFLGPKTPLQKLKDEMAQRKATQNDESGFMANFYAQSVAYNPQIATAIEREKPDLFILDSFLVPPAVRMASLPWIFLHSANPNFLYRSDKLPPFESGYPSNSDPETWVEFRELMKASWTHNKWESKLNREFGYEPKSEKETEMYGILSPFLNIYGYPAELDYNDLAPRPKDLANVEAFCRDEEKIEKLFNLPEGFVSAGEKLIYVSLGSMGSIDVELMQKILTALAKTKHKFIVSKGQRADEYELPENCWGEKHLPQTQILPLVDLVLTHGGNNTVTETMSFGKPMIVLPLFGDQYDNAQRVQEKGFGLRLEPYEFKQEELIEAVKKLLKDSETQERAKKTGERIRNSNAKQKVCERIEQVVRDYLRDN